MKIRSRGFRITEICSQVPAIEFDGESVRLNFITVGSQVRAQTSYLSRQDFYTFLKAMREAERMIDESPDSDNTDTPDADADDEDTPGYAPLVVEDRAGDMWYRHSNGLYSMDKPERASLGDRTFDSVRESWGPLTAFVVSQ